MSSAIVKFITLPFLAQAEILQSLSFHDIVNISSLSPKTSAIIKFFRLKVDSLTWKFSETKEHSIQLEKDFKILVSPSFTALNPDVPLETITLEDIEVKVFKTATCWYIAESNRSAAYYLDVLDRITKMLLKMCSIKKFNLETAWKMDVIDLFVWKYTRSLEYFHFPTHEYSGPELTFVLQNINVKTLELPEDFEEFKYTGPLTMDTLYLASGSWLTEELLKTMKCKEVIIDRHFSRAQCCQVIKLWLQGHLRNLEKFTMDAWILDTAGILDDIKTTPWNKKSRPGNFKYLDVSRGMDCQRADGTLATISTMGNFDFCVWHPKFLI